MAESSALLTNEQVTKLFNFMIGIYNNFLLLIINKADNSAIGAELTSHRSKLTFEVKGNQDKKLLI